MERLGEVPGRGHREGQDLRRAQPVGRGHAPGPAAGALPGPDAARTGARRASPSARSTKEAVYMTADRARRALPHPDAAAVQEPRQRGHLGRPRWRASSSAQAEEGGAYILTETAATQLLVEDGARRRRALRRQGPRQGRRAAGQLRAGHRHQGAGHRAGRGLLGPPHRRRDPRVRPRRGPRAAGLGARGQGGLEGRQAAGPPDPHDRPVAAEALGASTGRSAAPGSTR